jgi:glycosyltransferase involved in cell wall biosynthesis
VRPGVLVPAHGFSPFLAEALDSVLAQDPGPVVVIDDASPEPLRLHPDHAGRVTLVRREANGGPGPARDTGLTALPDECDLVALCDADDFWEPGRLDAQLGALEAHPGAAVCFGRATIVGPDDRPTGEAWPEPAPGLHAAAAFGRELYRTNPIPMSSVLLRRSWLDRVGGFDGGVPPADDWDVWLRIAAAGGDFVCEPAARVGYRRHPGGLTADVASLAAAQLVLHGTHRALAAPGDHEAAVAADRRALTSARVRAVVGRRDPYRRRRS